MFNMKFNKTGVSAYCRCQTSIYVFVFAWIFSHGWMCNQSNIQFKIFMLFSLQS